MRLDAGPPGLDVSSVISLYYELGCACCTRTRLVLAEKEIPFRRRIVSHADASEELDRLGARVPALLDDSFVVVGSTIIVEYLEDAFPRPPLRPADARGRATARMLQARIDRELTDPTEALAREVAGRASRDGASAPAPLRDAFFRWESRIGCDRHPFGSEFSVVDAWLLATLERTAEIGLRDMAELPNLVAFRERARGRGRVLVELGAET